MTKFIKSLLILINALVALSLLMVKIGTFVNPNTWIFPSYFSFFVFPLAFVNLFFLIFWSVLKKWWFLLPLSAFILFGGIITTSFPLHFSENKVRNPETKIRILSYNTMSCGSMKEHSEEKPNPVIKYILDTDADVVCLQEFSLSENKNQFQEEDFQKYFKKYPYKHIKFKVNKWNMHQGVATLSKYPIINKQNIDYEAKVNLSIYSDILIGKDTVRVINNHMESNRITLRDMQETSHLAQDFNSDKLSDMTKVFSEKISVASKVRGAQAVKIYEVIKNTPYKLIVCGDFNDVPASYTYAKVKGNLHDSYCENKAGLGWTFNRSFFRFRIDYILHDNSFESNHYKRGDLKASDHYPVQVDLYQKKD